jgi:predicted DNA-binding protein
MASGSDDHAPAGSRTRSVQFTLRIERNTNEKLRAIAARRGVTTSEAAREAIRAYAEMDGQPARLDAIVDRVVDGVVSRLSSGQRVRPPRP